MDTKESYLQTFKFIDETVFENLDEGMGLLLR